MMPTIAALYLSASIAAAHDVTQCFQNGQSCMNACGQDATEHDPSHGRLCREQCYVTEQSCVDMTARAGAARKGG